MTKQGLSGFEMQAVGTKGILDCSDLRTHPIFVSQSSKGTIWRIFVPIEKNELSSSP